ncbi:MAG: hypothetical protein NZM07_01110 [Elioraea sp.]|nr:hypothetical protein [Elioraea sp.]
MTASRIVSLHFCDPASGARLHTGILEPSHFGAEALMIANPAQHGPSLDPEDPALEAGLEPRLSVPAAMAAIGMASLAGWGAIAAALKILLG